MATRQEIMEAKGDSDAAIVINDSFINGLAKQLKQKCEYGMSFPADYNVNNALMGAYLTLKETKDKKTNKSLLESCSKASIANSLMDMATLGLSVQKKQGYFISYGGQCQFQTSYFGNITIARRYGLKVINAEVIYEGDTFKYHIEDGNKVLDIHTQDFKNIDNDKIIGAYAVTVMNDGSKHMEVMNISQIKKAWAQGYGYKENSTDTTHAKFTDQMAKKTVMNRALKYIIQTYGDAFVQEVSEKEENIPSASERVVADVEYDISENANKEEFDDTYVENTEVDEKTGKSEEVRQDVPEWIE